MRLAARLGTLAATGGMLAGTLLIGGASPANAAGVTFESFSYGNGREIIARVNGAYAGTTEWTQDPSSNGTPGDYLCATDDGSDGYYMTAKLSTGRSVSTSGKPAPSRACKGGDLTEDRTYKMKLCVTKSGSTVCSKEYEVTS